FFRKRWNSACRSTFCKRLSRGFSASCTMRNGASATLSFPRSGRRGFKGSLNRTSATPARAVAGKAPMPATIKAAVVPALASRRMLLGTTRRLSRRACIGGVELGEPGVVAPDVGVLRIQLQRFLVLGESFGVFPGRFERDR